MLQRRLISGVAGLALAGVAVAAQASMVEWRFGGIFTSVDRTGWGDLPAQVAVGSSFELLVSFDSEAELRNSIPAAGGGQRYNFRNTTLGMVIKVGSIEGSFDNDVQQDIIVRDNVPRPQPDPNPPLVDGVTFGLTDLFAENINGVAVDVGTNLIMRTLDLNALTISGNKMPTGFDVSALLDNDFSICRYQHGGTDGSCGFGEIHGQVNSLAIRSLSEPGGLGLSAVALLGLACFARRRSAPALRRS